MSIAEQETHIVANRQDLKDGFFLFYTNRQSHWNRVVRKVGRERMSDVKIEKIRGKPVSWSAKLPSACYSGATMGVRKYPSGKRSVQKLPENGSVSEAKSQIQEEVSRDL